MQASITIQSQFINSNGVILVNFIWDGYLEHVADVNISNSI